MFREITSCIYRKGVENPVAKWSIMINIPSIQKDQPEPSLRTFICELKTKHGLSSRCQDLVINTYEVSVIYKRTIAEPDFPKGGIFAVDTSRTILHSPHSDFAAFLVSPRFPI